MSLDVGDAAPEFSMPASGGRTVSLAALRGRAGRPVEAEPVYRAVIPDLWRVPDAMTRIRAVLAERVHGPAGGDRTRRDLVLPCAAARASRVTASMPTAPFSPLIPRWRRSSKSSAPGSLKQLLKPAAVSPKQVRRL